jgi:hypothetical protein
MVKAANMPTAGQIVWPFEKDHAYMYSTVDCLLNAGMDADLYDEFGNYIGPELESDDEEEEGYGDREPEAQEYDVSYS